MVIWTKERDNLLRRHYYDGDINELAKKVGTTFYAVKARARKLGLRRKNAPRPWTRRQLAALRDYYPEMTMGLLIILTRHSERSIRNKAAQLGLGKTTAYMHVPRPYSRKARTLIGQFTQYVSGHG